MMIWRNHPFLKWHYQQKGNQASSYNIWGGSDICRLFNDKP